MNSTYFPTFHAGRPAAGIARAGDVYFDEEAQQLLIFVGNGRWTPISDGNNDDPDNNKNTTDANYKRAMRILNLL